MKPRCMVVVAVAACGDPAATPTSDGGEIPCPEKCAAGTACVGGECVPTAWQFVETPTGAWLTGAWGFPDDTWIVGDRDTILHWDGTAFNELLPPDSAYGLATLSGVWGAASDDVWIAASPGGSSDAYGGSHLVHWDGTQWSGFVPRPPPSPTGATMTSVWGSSATDVWAVGTAFGEGTILHYDGGPAWTAITATTLPINNGLVIDGGFADVWGSAADNVWAVGQAGIWHYDGTWTEYAPQPSDEIFRSIHGSAADDVWVVAEGFEPSSRTIYRFDGEQWIVMPHPPTSYVGAIWSAAKDDVWAAGEGIFYFDGEQWTSVVPEATNLSTIWGAGAHDIWALGDGGTAWHYTVVP